MGRPPIDMTGEVYGDLTVLYRDTSKVRNVAHWVCQCICGELTLPIERADLLKGMRVSCGCRATRDAHYDHDTTSPKHKFWKAWANMKSRCKLGAHDQEYYYDRGIIVCERWHTYLNFKADMYDSYLEHCEDVGEEDTTLDRKDNDGNYCPENCRWATRLEQSHNSRRVRPFEATYTKPGKSFGYKEVSTSMEMFARKYNLHTNSIWLCLSGTFKQYKGWTFKHV